MCLSSRHGHRRQGYSYSHNEHGIGYDEPLSRPDQLGLSMVRALSLEPAVIVLDEPVSALDVSIRAQILNLLIKLQRQFNLTYIFIAHDLAVVEHISTHVGVMYLGKLVETAPKEVLYKKPSHPYTRALLRAVPVADPRVIKEAPLEGEVPSALDPPPGCRFHTRCIEAKEICSQEEPVLKPVAEGHLVACHLA